MVGVSFSYSAYELVAGSPFGDDFCTVKTLGFALVRDFVHEFECVVTELRNHLCFEVFV